MSRLIKKLPDELTQAQREQFERISRFRQPDADGQIGGPFDPWIRSPELARRAVSLGNFIWERTTLSRRIVELAIVVTARFWRSNVEWVAHARMARDQGVSQAVIDAVFEQLTPATAPADELLTIEVCRALHQDHELPADIYQRAVDEFGEQGLMEMIMTIGFYTFVSMTLNAFDVEVAPGEDTPF